MILPAAFGARCVTLDVGRFDPGVYLVTALLRSSLTGSAKAIDATMNNIATLNKKMLRIIPHLLLVPIKTHAILSRLTAIHATSTANYLLFFARKKPIAPAINATPASSSNLHNVQL